MKKDRSFQVLPIAVLLLVQLACSLGPSAAAPSSPPTSSEPEAQQAELILQLEGTKQALVLEQTVSAMAIQQTAVSLGQTQAALSAPTIMPPTSEPTAAPPPTSTPDPTALMVEKIKNAKILVYEDTVELGIGQWIEETLQRMGLTFTQTNDFSGEFMQHLNSGESWDLIIVGAENHATIQGEFWDVLLSRAQQKTAIIAEVWYMDLLGGGKMKGFTAECGVSYTSNWDLAESIYWVKPEHPLFTSPNTVLPLLHYNRYWDSNAGDKLRLRSTGDAEILAGATKSGTNSGLIAVCMEGRTVFQTFCNHDFHKDEIMDLWENYITYTLTNHFNTLD